MSVAARKRISEELALNQAVYKALAALDVSKADPATKYYVQRTLLEFHASLGMKITARRPHRDPHADPIR